MLQSKTLEDYALGMIADAVVIIFGKLGGIKRLAAFVDEFGEDDPVTKAFAAKMDKTQTGLPESEDAVIQAELEKGTSPTTIVKTIMSQYEELGITPKALDVNEFGAQRGADMVGIGNFRLDTAKRMLAGGEAEVTAIQEATGAKSKSQWDIQNLAAQLGLYSPVSHTQSRHTNYLQPVVVRLERSANPLRLKNARDAGSGTTLANSPPPS